MVENSDMKKLLDKLTNIDKAKNIYIDEQKKVKPKTFYEILNTTKNKK